MSFNNNINPSPEKINVEVKIGNIKYNLTTNESEEYINGIAKYINNKIQELSVSHKNLNSNSIPFFITMALNIADDLFKQRKQFAQSSKSLKHLEESYSKLNENNLYAENLKIKLEEKNSEISSLKNEILNISMEKDNQVNLLKDNYLNIIKSKDEEIDSLTNKINNSNDEIIYLKEQINNSNDEINSLTEEIIKLNEEINSLTEKTSDSNNEINSLTEEISNLNEEISSLTQQINNSNDEIIYLREKTSNSNNEINSLTEEISVLNQTISSLQKKTDEFSSLEDESLNLLYEKDKEIANLNKKIEELLFRLNISNKN